MSALNPMCVCGTTKDVIHGISVCNHCDDVSCKGITSGCPQCAKYNAVTNYRATKEYAREKNHG